jgi:hypothetical protein
MPRQIWRCTSWEAERRKLQSVHLTANRRAFFCQAEASSLSNANWPV